VIYDEVRKTSDFEIFADMRLAGVGLIGVTHANRAIDAVQRLIGRVELGMIPQVVDTVIHIMDGKVQQILELSFTVKVPAGMVEADLARPVILVRDFLTKRAEFEIYTYGEQVVVMPLDAATGGGAKKTGASRLAQEQLQHQLRRHIDGPFEVEVTSDSTATLYVPESSVPMVIGKAGSNVKYLEGALGMKFDVRPMRSGRGWDPGARAGKGRFDPSRPLRREAPRDDEDEEREEEEAEERPRHRYAEITPELRKSKKNFVLLVDRGLAGQTAEIVVDDEPVAKATIGAKGDVRLSRGSEAGEVILDALARGEVVRLRV
jgi:ATPase